MRLLNGDKLEIELPIDIAGSGGSGVAVGIAFPRGMTNPSIGNITILGTKIGVTASGDVVFEFPVNIMGKHRHQEWIEVLNLIKKDVTGNRKVHIICDNYATRNYPKVKAWERRNKRFRFHVTPTSASWLEAQLKLFETDLKICRGLILGAFSSVAW